MPLTFNGSTPENVNWNGVALSKVTYNGGVVWEKVTNSLLESCYWYSSSGEEEGMNAEYVPPFYNESTDKSSYACAIKIDNTLIGNSTTIKLKMKNGSSTSTVKPIVYTFKLSYSTLDGIYQTVFNSAVANESYLDKAQLDLPMAFDGWISFPITPSKYTSSGNYYVYIKSNIVGYNRWFATYGVPGGGFQPKFE